MIKMFSSRRAAKLFGLVCAGGVAASVAFAATAASDDPGKQDAAITEAARLAMEARYQIGAIDALATNPDANTSSVVAKGVYTRSARPALRQLTDGKVAAAHDASAKRLNRYFTGDALTQLLAANDRQPERYQPLTVTDGDPGSPAVTPSATPAYITTGGADAFTVATVISDEGGGATVTGTASTWVNTVIVEGGSTEVATPKSTVNFTIHLVKVGNDWKADRYEDPFAEGDAP